MAYIWTREMGKQEIRRRKKTCKRIFGYQIGLFLSPFCFLSSCSISWSFAGIAARYKKRKYGQE